MTLRLSRRRPSGFLTARGSARARPGVDGVDLGVVLEHHVPPRHIGGKLADPRCDVVRTLLRRHEDVLHLVRASDNEPEPLVRPVRPPTIHGMHFPRSLLPASGRAASRPKHSCAHFCWSCRRSRSFVSSSVFRTLYSTL